MNKYKKGLKAVVISGSEKGKESVITSVSPKNRTVILEKVNVVKRHTKANSEGSGTILEKEMPLPWGKVKVLGQAENVNAQKAKKTAKASKPKKRTKDVTE